MLTLENPNTVFRGVNHSSLFRCWGRVPPLRDWFLASFKKGVVRKLTVWAFLDFSIQGIQIGKELRQEFNHQNFDPWKSQYFI